MKTKHTPGRWEWKEGNEIEAEGVVLAQVLGADFAEQDPPTTDEVVLECNANARLIAAAPDLLAALESVLPDAEREVRRLNEQMVGSLYPAINEARLDRARAALAKARGEQS